jgi:hypothetical protein
VEKIYFISLETQEETMLERKIVIGLIISTPYLKKIRPLWNSALLESNTARVLSGWAVKHFDKYQKAPGKEIETIFFKRADKLDKELAEEIEQDILPDLSDEFVEEGVDVDYLFTETIEYLNTRLYIQHSDEIENTLKNGIGSPSERLKQVETIRKEFKPIAITPDESIDLSDPKTLRKVRKAFSECSKPILHFPKQLGKFWDAQFLPGGLIGILAPEKRGKTWLLLMIAKIAAKHKVQVALFQAGDMGELDQLRRIGINLTRRSNKEKY